jgi:hypothetical protein
LRPITKPRKENSDNISKFPPISLLNIEGKVLEKVVINRTNHHVFSHYFINTNQYRFTPQRCTIDVVMKVKDIIREGLEAGEVIVLVSLGVKGAFDAAWWPSILNGLRACDCSKILYDLTKSYLSQRTAFLSTNSIRMKREVSKGCA